MSIRYKTSLPENQKYFVLTIVQYKDGNISGMVYHELYENGHHYSNIIEMVNIIEEYSKLIEYPSKCVERRSFLAAPETEEPKAVMERVERRVKSKNTLASFRVKLEHQYQGSWQGNGENIFTGDKFGFISFLEFLKTVETQLPASSGCKLTMDLKMGKHIVEMRGQTFIIQVLFQEYGTWQGILYWTGKKEQVKFRSYLEMLLLIDEACAAGSEEKVIDFRKAANR